MSFLRPLHALARHFYPPISLAPMSTSAERADELDRAMFEDTLPDFVNAGSASVRMGLGTVARIVANGRRSTRRS
jgi:hypothetical protein